MARTVCFVVVLFFAVCAGLPVFAQQQVTADATALVKGEVVSVDVVSGAVVVKEVKDAAKAVSENVTLSISSETKIAKSDTVLKLVDLKAGDKIEAKVVKDKDVLKAQSIEIK